MPANVLGLAASTKLTDGGATTSLSFNILQIIVVAIAIGVAAVRVGALMHRDVRATVPELLQPQRLWVCRVRSIERSDDNLFRNNIAARPQHFCARNINLPSA